MNDLIFLFFRRMRAPLLVLICAYAIVIAGLVMIPSTDPDGNPWTFSFFHALYFVSFMGSTIGFGEIPYPFNDAQRLWTTVAVYICVIAWLYAIGSILALLQDPTYRRVFAEQLFTDRVRRMAEPFYLICGYGETGNLLVDALSRRKLRSVVIDLNTRRTDQIQLNNYGTDVPALNADAREVRYLTEAGLMHPRCAAAIALTNTEEINIKVAITAKLLRPNLPVVCRANTESTEANLASFNTDHIINPFQVFAEYLALALRMPAAHQLYSLLVSQPGEPLPRRIKPPHGTWIICGFGRFGKEVNQYLQGEGIDTVIIEPNPEQAPEGAVIGRGTEAVTLREAGVDQAAGLVAGADQDINNLSIIMTARELNPKLFVVARQNRRGNDEVFEAAHPDLIMETSRIMVMRILPLLTMPLLSRFLFQLRQRDGDWSEPVLKRLKVFCQRYTPHTWSVIVCEDATPALHQVITAGIEVKLKQLLKDADDPKHTIDCVTLMIRRGGKDLLLPDLNETLKIGDRLLFSSDLKATRRLEWILGHHGELEYQLTGERRPDGWLWRWLERRGWLEKRKPLPADGVSAKTTPASQKSP